MVITYTISAIYPIPFLIITIKRNDKPIAGVAVKFVMSNYSQNSNNYFENMLGETANIRCSDIAYFQVFILLQNMPYFENGGRISKWEQVNKNNLGKYLKLSEDNISDYYHTPTKTLIMMVKNRQISSQINDREAYIKFYENRDNIVFDITKDKYSFGDSIIFQDYKLFMDKICHYIEFI